MKKTCGFLAVAGLLIFAPLAGLTCHCVSEGCDSVRAATAVREPQCHHADNAAGGSKNSNKECCGKCRIERADLASPKLAESIADPAGKAVPAVLDVKGIEKVSTGLDVSNRILPKRASDFFTGYILNTTFAFRGPPAG